MTDRPMITLASAILEGDDLLILPLLKDLAGDGSSFDQRGSVGNLVAIAVKKDVGKHAFLPWLFIQEIDIDDVALGDTVLSASGSNNCVSHGGWKSREKSHGSGGLTSRNV